VVVGGANARTQLTLANNTTATIQNVSGYDAGELAGWIYIDATTDYRFYVQAQFVRGADNNYDVSYQTSGDTPPAGFLLSITNGGLLQYTMPNLAGFSATNSVINYALNAPAVGTNFPLSIDGSAVISGTVSASNLPLASASASGIVSTSAQTFAGFKTFQDGATITGLTSGAAISSGKIGSLSANFSRVAAGVSTGNGNVGAVVAIPAGVFLVVATCTAAGGSGMSFSSVAIGGSGTNVTTLSSASQKYSVSGTSSINFGTYAAYVNSTGTNIQFTYSLTGSSVDMSVSGYYIRIA
jgi:hypothetical protein